jgi:uncharacterized protein YaiI (UPF0178 family)
MSESDSPSARPERLLHIWIDADACPGPVRDVAIRIARSRGLLAVFVANRDVELPRDDRLSAIRVGPEFGAADTYIVTHLHPGDIVITADVPLAAASVNLGACAVGPRGTRYTEENVGDELATRNLMQSLRESGIVQTAQKPHGDSDTRRFADALDRAITLQLRAAQSPTG